MSNDGLPKRPEGVDGGEAPRTTPMPRVEVEASVTGSEEAGRGRSEHEEDGVSGGPAFGDTHAGGEGSGSRPVDPTSHQETVTHTVVKTKTKKLPVFIAALGGVLVGAVLVVALMMTGSFTVSDEDTVQPTQNIKVEGEDPDLASAVASKALPSVVSVTGLDETGEAVSVGSGVILDADGNILTNYHVISDAADLTVSINGDVTRSATLVGSDESSDLAVIRIDDTSDLELVPIELGDSDDLQVGDWVMAIGSPFGNEQSVSTGIVSALYRSTALPSTNGTSIYANMIQTDAAINPGNSGGALVDSEGRLVGINSVIESYSGSSSGVGFAIPVNYAVDIANQIIDGKTPVHPYLGVTLTSVNSYMADRDKLPVEEGARVVEIAQGGPAEAAGLQVDDIITEIDGEPVTSADNLIIAIRTHEVGDEVTLTYMRGAKKAEAKVTLGSDEALQQEQADGTQGDGSGNSMTDEELLQYLQELLGSRGVM